MKFIIALLVCTLATAANIHDMKLKAGALMMKAQKQAGLNDAKAEHDLNNLESKLHVSSAELKKATADVKKADVAVAKVHQTVVNLQSAAVQSNKNPQQYMHEFHKLTSELVGAQHQNPNVPQQVKAAAAHKKATILQGIAAKSAQIAQKAEHRAQMALGSKKSEILKDIADSARKHTIEEGKKIEKIATGIATGATTKKVIARLAASVNKFSASVKHATASDKELPKTVHKRSKRSKTVHKSPKQPKTVHKSVHTSPKQPNTVHKSGVSPTASPTLALFFTIIVLFVRM